MTTEAANTLNAQPTMPLISVITVVYNDPEHLEATICSVINQSFKDFEYIIIDGGSTDGRTLPIIQKYSQHLAFWCSEPDKGIYDAMRKGVSHARGQYVVMKNAGDFFEPDIFGHIAKTIEQSGADVVYGDTIKLHPHGGQTLMRSHLEGLRKANTVDHRNMFVRRQWLEQYPFDLQYKLCADYHQTLQMWKSGARFVHCGRVVSRMLPYGKSFSVRTYQEVYLIQRQFFKFPRPQINFLRNIFWYYTLKMKRMLYQAMH